MCFAISDISQLNYEERFSSGGSDIFFNEASGIKSEDTPHI